MSVSRKGGTLKEFKAACPVGKQLVARVYSRAMTYNIRHFLEAVLRRSAVSAALGSGQWWQRVPDRLRGYL
ncbi:MAG: hypothetical protein OXK72_04145 [Gammaproteobacteria bacterium]|nr:hypothetical protein [Gammaproteobacteria bacterium]